MVAYYHNNHSSERSSSSDLFGFLLVLLLCSFLDFFGEHFWVDVSNDGVAVKGDVETAPLTMLPK
jgi:hypothetical protein